MMSLELALADAVEMLMFLEPTSPEFTRLKTAVDVASCNLKLIKRSDHVRNKCRVQQDTNEISKKPEAHTPVLPGPDSNGTGRV
jgi:hypothetical protein